MISVKINDTEYKSVSEAAIAIFEKHDGNIRQKEIVKIINDAAGEIIASPQNVGYATKYKYKKQPKETKKAAKKVPKKKENKIERNLNNEEKLEDNVTSWTNPDIGSDIVG